VKIVRARYLTFYILVATVARAAAPSDLPTTAPAGLDAGLWERMKLIDQAAARIEDLTADFEQQKFTPLLKNPMTSVGTVWARRSQMLWNTRAPEPTVLHVDESQVMLFYPKQRTVEIYPLSGQLAQLAASPVPRLADLLRHFRFAPASAQDLGVAPDPNHEVFLLTPTDPEIREHLKNVTVLIDAKAGYILEFKSVDADDEITILRFSDVKTNSKFDDARLQLNLPADVKTIRPLATLGR
jgi:outer membrane lipoprotein-sorting protein